METVIFSLNNLKGDPSKMIPGDLLNVMRIYCPQEIKWS